MIVFEDCCRIVFSALVDFLLDGTEGSPLDQWMVFFVMLCGLSLHDRSFFFAEDAYAGTGFASAVDVLIVSQWLSCTLCVSLLRRTPRSHATLLARHACRRRRGSKLTLLAEANEEQSGRLRPREGLLIAASTM